MKLQKITQKRWFWPLVCAVSVVFGWWYLSIVTCAPLGGDDELINLQNYYYITHTSFAQSVLDYLGDLWEQFSLQNGRFRPFSSPPVRGLTSWFLGDLVGYRLYILAWTYADIVLTAWLVGKASRSKKLGIACLCLLPMMFSVWQDSTGNSLYSYGALVQSTLLPALVAGLAVLRRLSPAKRILLAVPREMHLHFDDVEVVRVTARYPASVDALLVKSVTGKEKPEGVGVVGLHNVWSLGRVARTGLPLIESVITLGSYTHSGNYIVKEGSMLGELLEFAHIKLNSGDTLVRGGPLRGESIDRLDRSITKGATGVFVVAGTVPPMEGHSPCINCGACVLICPARLSPSMLSRNAEFALHERCRDEHVDCCLECGLCGYVCIARRPVLQYIRLAKHKLAQADEARRLKERELRPAAQPAAEAKEGEN